ncbi:MAG UNVERIFIED_CONTAM: zinc-finger domain-containing protein [Rickettsiaceae bacterium]|jgi:uncharacterized Zn-finger protein
MKNNKEEIKVSDRKVSCEGSEYPYDHPKVYLEISDDKKQTDCPYCGRRFITKSNN